MVETLSSSRTRPSRGSATRGRRRLRRVSVLLPACDEAASLPRILEGIRALRPSLEDAGYAIEVLVVDDGSDDGTGVIARAGGARVVRHPRRLGNGAAVKRGVRAARGEWIVLLDADGQHPPSEIPRLLAALEDHDLVVGERERAGRSGLRRFGNVLLNLFASYVAGTRIPDLTSGFRAARTRELRRFLYLLPNGFSYPTTSTLAFLRAGLSVAWIPVSSGGDGGRSHLRPFDDGARFLVVALRIATIFSPMRLFFPLSLSIAACAIANYLYTYWTQGRFTNMSVLLGILAAIAFSLGLISEQIAALRFERSEDAEEEG